MADASETERDGELRELLARVFATQRLAVLATHHEGQPYCSLVGFAASEDLSGLLFATARATRKFRNLTGDPRVAMMVDTRTHRDRDFREAVAVTAVGRAREVAKTPEGPLLRTYLARQPELSQFVLSADCALLRLEVERYVVVHGLREVSELRPG
ncbi:MAG TPA: pyridoxamine 5'-phosphate oxidase family protein [Phycisphaerae bacterium]|nr:pyridoxamine 5'-phosphate oxidase family protein [Phycisphaerae bacterium]